MLKKKKQGSPKKVNDFMNEVNKEMFGEDSSFRVECFEEQVSEELNADEKEVIAAHAEEVVSEVENVSTKKMEAFVNVVEGEFNLKGKNFSVTSFKDGTKNLSISIANDDFTLNIELKNPEKYEIQ